MEYYPDLPSPLLASYIAEVEAATNQSISIAPFPDASDEDELQAAINIGPSYEGIDIKFRPHWPLGHPAIEKALAHELTHGLMIYSMGYPVVDASEDVAAEIVQMAAEVMDLIDDVIIDVMIQERGFPAITPEHLQPYLNNSRILEVAQSRDQISDPHRSDPMATEIFFVGNYIYSWGLPRYAKIDKNSKDTFRRFTRRFPQIMKQEFAKAKKIKKLMLANDIFQRR